MSAGDERRARWNRQRPVEKPRAAATPPAAAPPTPSVKPACDGCKKREPLVGQRDGEILCRACLDAKAPAPDVERERELGEGTPDRREIQCRAIADGAFALGCVLAAQTGRAVRVYGPAADEDDEDDEGEPVEFMAHVVGSYVWPDGTVTYFFREVPKDLPSPPKGVP